MADRPFEPIRDGTDRSRSRVGDADENGSYVQTEVFTSEHDEDALVEAHGNVLPPATPTGAIILSPTSPAFVPSSLVHTMIRDKSLTRRQTSTIKE